MTFVKQLLNSNTRPRHSAKPENMGISRKLNEAWCFLVFLQVTGRSDMKSEFGVRVSQLTGVKGAQEEAAIERQFLRTKHKYEKHFVEESPQLNKEHLQKSDGQYHTCWKKLTFWLKSETPILSIVYQNPELVQTQDGRMVKLSFI